MYTLIPQENLDLQAIAFQLSQYGQLILLPSKCLDHTEHIERDKAQATTSDLQTSYTSIRTLSCHTHFVMLSSVRTLVRNLCQSKHRQRNTSALRNSSSDYLNRHSLVVSNLISTTNVSDSGTSGSI
ncbi:hypothetical protein INT43_001266 [Umbelopsis isabellina]|uniref:Uncharacterized protein n=1 Tax=Mortierella isabellina TaxID=91625 RepID=A0A8H7PK51_MORIS|nr:hypothetical protein INT43_001266 [Umbelopsis isabellina]